MIFADEVHQFSGGAQVQAIELAHLFLEHGSLAFVFPFAEDALDLDLGGDGQLAFVHAHLDGGGEDFVEALEAGRHGPEREALASGEVRDGEGVPFVHVDEALELMAEGAEEGGLPVQVLGQTIEHVAQGFRPAAQAQEFMHEDVRAGGVKLLVRLITRHRVRQAELAEGERGTMAQEQTSLAHRIGGHPAPRQRGLRLERQ